ncbi:MAG TPA: MFS transporter [Steroidobacteraceae bacterium]|jgi:MHS family proline/betaine transporter-like MFS transporter|nr:MFS transporter [Steroidobacteraceae bacterium]
MDPDRTTSGTRAIIAASLGNLLEWYDFAVYALFAIYIGANFFPPGASGAGLVSAFLVFGLGFVIRPLGAVVIGIYGDRAGRKAALTATILIMACGTLIIAIAPTYAAIGIGAAWVLLAGRVLQGFSAGGEIGSATAFLVEHAPAERKALFAAWLQASMGMSNILGALTAFIITSLLPHGDMVRFGWRIPFFIGLAIVPMGLYLRRTLAETPAFRAEMSVERLARQPLRRVFREHPGELAAGFGISILWAIEVYVLLIFMPVFLQRTLGFMPAQAFGSSLAENVVFVIGCFAFGALADRVGQRRVQVYGAVALLVSILPLFTWLDHSRSMGVLICVLCACGIMTSSFSGVAPMALSSLFPTAVRATGVSLAYNAGFTLFGGFAPAILAALTATGAGIYAPAWFVMLAALPALLALRFQGGQSPPALRPVALEER